MLILVTTKNFHILFLFHLRQTQPNLVLSLGKFFNSKSNQSKTKKSEINKFKQEYLWNSSLFWDVWAARFFFNFMIWWVCLLICDISFSDMLNSWCIRCSAVSFNIFSKRKVSFSCKIKIIPNEICLYI